MERQGPNRHGKFERSVRNLAVVNFPLPERLQTRAPSPKLSPVMP
jgi:hypothetical protein